MCQSERLGGYRRLHFAREIASLLETRDFYLNIVDVFGNRYPFRDRIMNKVEDYTMVMDARAEVNRRKYIFRCFVALRTG